MDRMSTGRQLNRRVGEFFVVFLGVALAFFAESLREEWQDRGAAQELTVALVEDLETTLNDLRATRLSAMAKRDASLEAREHLRSRTPTIPMDSLSYLLAHSGAINIQAPILRSYDQLVATGLLRLLRRPVRDALADWVADLELTREYQERDLLDFRQSVAFPYWAQSPVSFEQMLGEYYPDLELGAPRFPHTWAILHEDQQLPDVLVQFAAMTASVVGSYERQEATLVELIDLLREDVD